MKTLIFLGLTIGDGLLIFFSYYFLLGYNPSYVNLWYLTPIILLSNIYYSCTYGGGIIITLLIIIINQWPLFFLVMRKPMAIFVPILAIGIKFSLLHCFHDNRVYYLGSAAGQEKLTYNCPRGFNYPLLLPKDIKRAINKSVIFEKSNNFWEINREKSQAFKSVKCLDGNPIDNRFAENARINRRDPVVSCGRANKLIIFFTNNALFAQSYINSFSQASGANLFLVTDNPELMFLQKKTVEASGWNFKSFLLTSGGLNRDVNNLLKEISTRAIFDKNKSLVFIDCYKVNQFNFADYFMLINRLRTSIPVSRLLNINIHGISFTDSLLNLLKKLIFLEDPSLFNFTVTGEIYQAGLGRRFHNCYLNESIAFIDVNSFVAAINYCTNISNPEILKRRHFSLKINERIQTNHITQVIASYEGISLDRFHLAAGGEELHPIRMLEDPILGWDPVSPIPNFNYPSFVQAQIGKSSLEIFKNLQKVLSQIYLTQQD